MLNQGVGYSVILGFGAFFAVFTSFLVSQVYVIEVFLPSEVRTGFCLDRIMVQSRGRGLNYST